jgi:hypothetical protein
MKIFTSKFQTKNSRFNLFNTNISIIYYKKFNEKYRQDDTMKKITLKINNENQTNLPVVPEENDLLFADPVEFERENKFSKMENLANFKKHIELENKKFKVKTYHRTKIALSLFILFLGVFSLWVPLYRTICESQGFSVKSSHTDYKFDGKECKYYNKYSKAFP